MIVSWNDVNNLQEPGEYPFLDGTLVVSFVEIAVWQNHPSAYFQLMRNHPIQAHPKYLLGRQVDATTDKLPAEQRFYDSSNGDSWSLTSDPATGARSVIHRPNVQSGGRPSYREIENFLTEHANGPEHQALRHLLETGADMRTI